MRRMMEPRFRRRHVRQRASFPSPCRGRRRHARKPGAGRRHLPVRSARRPRARRRRPPLRHAGGDRLGQSAQGRSDPRSGRGQRPRRGTEPTSRAILDWQSRTAVAPRRSSDRRSFAAGSAALPAVDGATSPPAGRRRTASPGSAAGPPEARLSRASTASCATNAATRGPSTASPMPDAGGRSGATTTTPSARTPPMTAWRRPSRSREPRATGCASSQAPPPARSPATPHMRYSGLGLPARTRDARGQVRFSAPRRASKKDLS
jgi:hypothetical protein